MIYLNWKGFLGLESSYSYSSLFEIISNTSSNLLWNSSFSPLSFLSSTSSQKQSITLIDIYCKTRLSSSIIKIVQEIAKSSFWKNISCPKVTLPDRDLCIWLFITLQISIYEAAQAFIPFTAYHFAILYFTTAFAYSISSCVRGV